MRMDGAARATASRKIGSGGERVRACKCRSIFDVRRAAACRLPCRIRCDVRYASSGSDSGGMSRMGCISVAVDGKA